MSKWNKGQLTRAAALLKMACQQKQQTVIHSLRGAKGLPEFRENEK